MSTSLKVSIITPVWNGGETISETLYSVAIQDYPNIEHIVIDGSSKDDSLGITKEYPHVKKIVSEPDEGIYDAINKGLSMATGDIIGILNSDDLYTNQHVIKEMVEKMEQAKTDAIYADLVYVEPDNINVFVREWISGTFEVEKFYRGWMPPHPTFFVRKKVYNKFGLFNTNIKVAADYELMLRFLLKYKISTTYLPKVIVKMRAGGVSNGSFLKHFRTNQEDRMAWKVNQLKCPFYTTLLKPLRKIPQFF